MEVTRKFKKEDEYETPIEYWSLLTKFIPKTKLLYDPFYMNGNAQKKWNKLGYKMKHTDEDFFFVQPPEDCIVVSSPPFSLRNQVLRRLYEWNKPFIMLMPISTICFMKTQPIIRNRIQLIIPNIFKGFINKKGEDTRCPPFYLAFFCYKMNLPKDIIHL